MQARRALQHFPYWGGGKIEHLILCCHSVLLILRCKITTKK